MTIPIKPELSKYYTNQVMDRFRVALSIHETILFLKGRYSKQNSAGIELTIMVLEQDMIAQLELGTKEAQLLIGKE